MLTLTRALVILDIESTGVDPVEDRIIEIGIVILTPDSQRKRWKQRFSPGIPIKPGAIEKHHITDEDVKDCPPFKDFAKGILTAIAGKDICVYNGWRLDLPMLDEELRRCGLKLDLKGVEVIDAFGIFSAKEQRRLEDAVRKFCNREPSGAHGALTDAEDTLDVLLGEMAAYPDVGEMDLASLAAFSRRGSEDGREPVDLAGKLYRDKDGGVRYAFGKARDARVADDPSFGEWMLRQRAPGFPGSTCDALRAEFERLC